MMEVFTTQEFQDRYKDLPQSIQKKAERQERIFKRNPFYSSLHTEKLEPKGKQIWSFRIDKKYRIFFRFVSRNKATFLTVGSHDWIYKLRF
ncbi:type II toxin-antitoxin system YoeB family toxin [Patescibacteria group bacterium]|nr:type II toxin-antitoxin system YoeB family toxin [Patescibacteria group bacterium]